MTPTENLFTDCEIDEIMALVFDQTGQDGLQALLGKAELPREDLDEVAEKLADAGLIEAAGMVRKAAERAKASGISPKAQRAKIEAARRYWGGGRVHDAE